MALAWMKRSKRPASVDDLVSRGKYAKALELMRKEFSQHYPSVSERLRFADVLVLAGKDTEAVPVLLGIADEQERYGFADKALEALRRAAEIDPDQAEVRDRLEAIRTAPQEAPADSATGDPAASGSGNWGAALDGAFGAYEAPATPADETAEPVDTGFDSSMLAAPGASEAETGEPTSVGSEEQGALLSDEDMEAVPEPFGDPAADSTPELEEGLLEPEEEEEEPEAPPQPLAAAAARVAVPPEGEEPLQSAPAPPPAPAPAAAAGAPPEMQRDILEPGDVEIDAHVLEPAEEELERLCPPTRQPLQRPFLSAEELEAEIEDDAKALLAQSAPKAEAPRPLLTETDLEEALEAEARELLAKKAPATDELRPLITEEELDEDRTGDARALLGAEMAAPDPPGPLVTDQDLEDALADDARALLGGGPPREESHPLITEDDLRTGSTPLLPTDDLEPLSEEEEEELHEFVLALGQKEGSGRSALGAVFFFGLGREELRRVAAGLHPRAYAAGEMVIQEGEPGDSVFLMASGSVRILVLGGHGQPFEIRRIDAGDFFGEVAALSGRPRTATVVADSPCEMLEIDRGALDVLVGLRPAARALLDEACVGRALSPEETAVRSLPPEAADPRRAAEALRAHFGGCDWSPRVRLHLARLMMDVGREEDALAILAGVAEDLARRGHAQKAIAVLKKVETIQRRGLKEVNLAPLKAGKRRSSARRASGHDATPTAVRGAAFREWVGSLLRETAALAARSAPAIEEEAEAPGEEQRSELAG